MVHHHHQGRWPICLCLLLLLPLHLDGLRFHAIGDWGDSTTGNQTRLAQVMKEDVIAPDFVIALGDNFYPAGVKSVEDPSWSRLFESVYEPTSPTTPWYAILGNHDYYSGHPEAQIQFTTSQANKGSRWQMPDYYYTLTYPLGKGKNETLQIVYLDTIPLAAPVYRRQLLQDIRSGELPLHDVRHLRDLMSPPTPPQKEEDKEEQQQKEKQHKKKKDKKKRINPGPTTVPDANTQMTWLESTLHSSTADWLIVCGHFPVYSASEHGDTPELVEHVKPLLHKYQVDAYLNGHDHNLQHLQDEEGLDYFVSGTGGAAVYLTMDQHHPHLTWYALEVGYLRAQLEEGGIAMKMEFVGVGDKVLYTTTIQKKRRRR